MILFNLILEVQGSIRLESRFSEDSHDFTQSHQTRAGIFRVNIKLHFSKFCLDTVQTHWLSIITEIVIV